MLETRNSESRERSSLLRLNAGLSERTISTSQRTRPTNKQNLPQPAEVDVFVTLAAEPEPQVAKLLLDAEPFAGQRTAHHKHQRAEQHIDAQALVLRFMPADCRADVQAGRQPRGGDPEDGDLQVPGARDGVGQVFVEREAVEALAFHAVVRGDGAHQDLHAPEDHDHEEVLDGRTLRRRGRGAEERVARRKRSVNGSFSLR